VTNPNCPNCRGTGTVCSVHRDKAWLDGKGCCGEPGDFCDCNPEQRFDWKEIDATANDTGPAKPG